MKTLIFLLSIIISTSVFSQITNITITEKDDTIVENFDCSITYEFLNKHVVETITTNNKVKKYKHILLEKNDNTYTIVHKVSGEVLEIILNKKTNTIKVNRGNSYNTSISGEGLTIL